MSDTTKTKSLYDLIGPDCFSIIYEFYLDLKAVERHRFYTSIICVELEMKVKESNLVLKSRHGGYRVLRTEMKIIPCSTWRIGVVEHCFWINEILISFIDLSIAHDRAGVPMP